MKILNSVFFFFLAQAAHGWCESSKGEPLVVAEKFSIYSDVLNEDRAYWVSLPPGYNDDIYAKANYPVIYVLDGDWYASLTSSMIANMASWGYKIPYAIVVNIETVKNRFRDFTPTHSLTDISGSEQPGFSSSGGEDRFLEFLESELIPHIETKYRTAPHRTIIGHSLGGLAVAHAFLARPELFQGYISIDGSLWWQDQILVEKAQTTLIDLKRPKRAYFSISDHDTIGPKDASNMILGNMRFVEVLNKKKNLPNLDVKLQPFDDETHGSVVPLSLYYGLRYVFAGHDQLDVEFANVAQLVNNYEELSKRFGFKYLPQERFVDFLAGGLSYYFPDDKEKLLLLLKYNVSLYATSSNAHGRLADAYADNGNVTLAIEHYQKALDLYEGNDTARKKLEELQHTKIKR